MSQSLQIAVNTSIYDGYDLDDVFASIKKCGYHYFELAYNQGYVGNLSPDLFGKKNADKVNSLKDKYQLKTVALGCTMNLAADNMVESFKMRIDFARMIGATYLNACVTKKSERTKLITNLKAIAPYAEEYNCVICLENGGDYNYDVFTSVEDGINIISEVGSNAVSMNFDPGNMVTFASYLDVIEQSLKSIPYCDHFHIKDVKIIDGEFYFPIIGEGVIEYAKIIPELIKYNIPTSFEIPFRMHRKADSTPIRSEQKADWHTIENVLIQSRLYLEKIAAR